ncbi:hydantoinase/oxoprolinase family protein [Chelatococcus asaccharovorans]|uniref:hydantoinase/oxoprolinase family protein n=1 Tax=Chelatococcus asaccharovorans TaxID=28210 RepID=UPI00224C6E5D|nr:hydantoinase/oxoprolinase family protein [Chelatococcus asaccharovorans]CAH1663108.1 N-methylhydantoinase A [Chelatococcus asaccharovorans]CAH1682938.1 N-methylhydantoinase A [Chelatococcus asaccharovorans]
MGGMVGIDVGGTFTDLIYSADGQTVSQVLKVPSTPDDPSRAIVDALAAGDIEPRSLDIVLHGTTIATNAVIERKGARCALLTTRGFRDILELGRRDRQQMYGLTGVHHPLVPRQLRAEVDERLDHRGTIITPLDEEGVRAFGMAMKAQEIEAIVVAFLHCYANPIHENRAAEILREISPAWEVVTSSGVIREYYEFERTSTATVQAYLQPLVARYAANLQKRLNDKGFAGETLVMQSNGGLVPLPQLPGRAANIVRSGPAAGVMAAARIAADAGFPHVITGDMGGTSYDVAVLVNGVPRIAETTDLDFRIPLRLPMIDVHTIGAGGGSIAYVDRGGILQVGPRSAGAVPGPVCFGRGGTEPTVADANAVLARINADQPIGLKHLASLDIDGARRAIARLGEQIGLGIEATAEAILAVVNQRMAGRTRLLSVERGHDPRDFALVAFGGAGPLHGAAIMREVGVRTMLLPPNPGVLCAFGCSIADLRYDLSQTVEQPVAELDAAWIADVLRGQRKDGEAQILASGIAAESITVSHYADMAYVGQIHSLRVPIGGDWSRERMVEAFEAVYQQEYGNTLGAIPTVVVGLKTAVTGVRSKAPAAAAHAVEAYAAKPDRTRPVHFGEWLETPVYDRRRLRPGATFRGPAIVEQADTTSVIEPGMVAKVDQFGNILVEIA